MDHPPVVEVQTREGRSGPEYIVSVPMVLHVKKNVGNVQVAQWLAKNLQEWMES